MSRLLRFFTTVHGRQLPSASAGLAKPLPVTFDAVVPALQRLPRMFIEPDGSLVWTGIAAQGQPWQVDGNLIDLGESLDYVELKGDCPEEQFDLLLGALGWPEAPLAFQLPRRGLYLDETQFRQQAATELGAG